LNFIIDAEAKKSYLVGNNGSSEVILFNNEGNTSFLEITGTGNLMTTSIDESLNSVHSRNTVVFGEMMPSQYYGRCELK
jgi:hypothetical protein